MPILCGDQASMRSEADFVRGRPLIRGNPAMDIE